MIRPTHHTARVRAAALLIVAALGLAGCATTAAPDADEAPGSTTETGTWPRTVTVNGSEVTLAAQPVRIVALSTETGDLGLELVGPERFAAVANGSVTPGTGNRLEEASKVATALPAGTKPDPETILALQPDLVLMTGRHAGEQDVAAVLESSGVPTVAFESSDFATPNGVVESITELGALLGAENAASTITTALRGQIEQVTSVVAGASTSPRVAVLFARGGKAMLMGKGSATTELVTLAGGTSVAGELGWMQAVAADPETIIAAKPDVILVQDFRDQGLAPFATLLENPALAGVPAVADGKVKLVDAETTSGTSGSRIGEGLRAIASVLHPDLVQ